MYVFQVKEFRYLFSTIIINIAIVIFITITVLIIILNYVYFQLGFCFFSPYFGTTDHFKQTPSYFR